MAGGQRLDDKQFQLQPAQTFAVFEYDPTTSSDDSPELVALTTKGEHQAIDDRHQCPGEVSGPGPSGPVFLAQGAYTDFHRVATEFRMTGFGQFVAARQSEDDYREFARDGRGGQIVTTIDELGNAVCYTYDPYGNVAALTDYPDGPGASRPVTKTFEYSFEEFNVLKKSTDEVGRVTEYSHDNFVNVLSRKITDSSALEGQPSSSQTRYTYFPGGLLRTTTDGEDNTVSQSYDPLGRLDRIVFVDGEQKFEYADRTGNVSAIVDPNGHRAEFKYDAMNRLRETHYFLQDDVVHTASTDYDAHGNVIGETNLNGGVTTLRYDELNRPVAMVAAVGVFDYETFWSYSFGAVPALEQLVRDHTFSMPGPWDHLTKTLARDIKSLDDFKQFVDAPFVSRQVLDDLSDFVRLVREGKVNAPGLDPNDLVARGERFSTNS